MSTHRCLALCALAALSTVPRASGEEPRLARAAPSVVSAGASLCADALRDQASDECLQASTIPMLGRLYPISVSLFVATGGNVGIGTTSPAAALHVAGTARIASTLTLDGFDHALDIPSQTGAVFMSGAIFMHTRGVEANTALGRYALESSTVGYSNTAVGEQALRYNDIGIHNTAVGADVLMSTICGSFNTATGSRALFINTTGEANTATGAYVLRTNTTGRSNTATGLSALIGNLDGSQNTALGALALFSNTSGSRNIAVGYRAGRFSTGDDNIAIGSFGVAGESGTIRIGGSGTHARAFVAGIRGVTTGMADAIQVVVDSAGQLGTLSSSRRSKEDIADMGDATERLLELRPVVFRYRQEQAMPDGGAPPLEYGLIAEEVAEVFPELVVHDEQGEPFTVKYHLLSSMLLNEMKRMNAAHARELGAPDATVGAFGYAGLGYQFDLVSGSWGLTAEFPHDPAQVGANDRFGSSMGLGRFAVAGAPNPGPGGNPGSAHVAVPCAP